MKLGLVNTLTDGRGGGISGDGLSLDLQFALDKTLTARKGPTPVFTRASSGTFVGSNGLIQTAATNIPRFDHTSAGVCRGLLIEESRTNAFQHSANFKDTTSSNYWENLSSTTITVDQITSPDGGVNADLLSTSTTSFDCFTRRSGFWAGSAQYTYSIFIKRGPSNYRYVGFYIGAGASGTQFPYFDFDNPTTVQIPTITSGTINSTGVDAYPNGWYRIRITFTTAATPITTFAGVYISSSNGNLQGVNPAGNNCYIWGIQSELGSFATSYIPTTTGSAVRSADVCSITGADFTIFYNQSEGTIIGQGIVDTVGVGLLFPYFASFNDGTANNRVLLGSTNSASSGVRPIVAVAGSTSFTNTIGTSSAGQSRKVGMVYKQNDFIAAHNGTLTAADNTGNVPSGVDRVAFDSPFFVGTIAAIRYYRKRLPNAKLQALTA